jgi:hypothetical protein
VPLINRVVTAADGVELTGSHLNELQDRTVIMRACTDEDEGLALIDPPNSTGFMGAIWKYGEFTLAAGNNVVMDNTRDFKNRHFNMVVVNCGAANELPSGANHYPGAPLTLAQLCWNAKAGEPVGGPFGAGTSAWKPFGGSNLYLFADSTTGFLTAENTDGAATYWFYVLVLSTVAI